MLLCPWTGLRSNPVHRSQWHSTKPLGYVVALFVITAIAGMRLLITSQHAYGCNETCIHIECSGTDIVLLLAWSRLCGLTNSVAGNSCLILFPSHTPVESRIIYLEHSFTQSHIHPSIHSPETRPIHSLSQSQFSETRLVHSLSQSQFYETRPIHSLSQSQFST